MHGWRVVPVWDMWLWSADCWGWPWFVSGSSGRGWRSRPLRTRSTPPGLRRWPRGRCDTRLRTTLRCGLPCPLEDATLRTPRRRRSHTPRTERPEQMEELDRGQRGGEKFDVRNASCFLAKTIQLHETKFSHDTILWENTAVFHYITVKIQLQLIRCISVLTVWVDDKG